MLSLALGMWLATEDAVVVMPQAGISCRFMCQTQICIKIVHVPSALFFIFEIMKEDWKQ